VLPVAVQWCCLVRRWHRLATPWRPLTSYPRLCIGYAVAKICAACGHRTSNNDPGWCPGEGCGLDNAWVDDVGTGPRHPGEPDGSGRLVRADAIDASELPKTKTGTPFDAPLGGGVPRGACLLVWGRSGSGKTRLVLRLCGQMHPAVFVSREMPEEQTAGYLAKLDVERERVWITRDTDWRAVALRVRPKIVAIDSISVWGYDAPREMAAAYEWAHAHRVTVIAICHTTKSGEQKGSSELAHYSDAALVVRQKGKGRVTLHAPSKNRFAPTGPLAPVGVGSIV
jgi:predicted ATP-dependent serine protease